MAMDNADQSSRVQSIQMILTGAFVALALASLIFVVESGPTEYVPRRGGARDELYRSLPDQVKCTIHYGDYIGSPPSPEEMAILKYPGLGVVVERKLLFVSKRGNPCYEVTIEKYPKWRVK